MYVISLLEKVISSNYQIELWMLLRDFIFHNSGATYQNDENELSELDIRYLGVVPTWHHERRLGRALSRNI